MRAARRDRTEEGAEGAEFATKAELAVLAAEVRAEIAAVRSELREMEQRLVGRFTGEILAAKAGLLGRMLQMILERS